MTYDDEDTDTEQGNGFYTIHLYCPCMDMAGNGTIKERTWGFHEMILVDDPAPLIAAHANCPQWQPGR